MTAVQKIESKKFAICKSKNKNKNKYGNKLDKASKQYILTIRQNKCNLAKYFTV